MTSSWSMTSPRPTDPAVPIPGPRSPRPTARRRGRRTVKAEEAERRHFAPEQRMLILSAWQRSGLSAKDFAPLVGVRQPTLYSWKKLFEEHGPAGLEKKPKKGGPGGRLPEATKQAILMMKEAHPNWGADRLHDMLLRSEGHTASPRVIQRLLVANGYQVVEEQTHKHPPKVRRFEAAAPNALWQTDLFTFLLKRQNRRVHLVAFMDDHSRFITGFGLHATASGALVREVFERAAANFGSPRACLTDNGTQYKTWRGKSAFTKLCEKRGIEHIVASPRRPQTLGKIERFWKTDARQDRAVLEDTVGRVRRRSHLPRSRGRPQARWPLHRLVQLFPYAPVAGRSRPRRPLLRRRSAGARNDVGSRRCQRARARAARYAAQALLPDRPRRRSGDLATGGADQGGRHP
jgi:transposase InsO family protein